MTSDHCSQKTLQRIRRGSFLFSDTTPETYTCYFYSRFRVLCCVLLLVCTYLAIYKNDIGPSCEHGRYVGLVNFSDEDFGGNEAASKG